MLWTWALPVCLPHLFNIHAGAACPFDVHSPLYVGNSTKS